MTDSFENERERIRERKRQRLLEEHGEGTGPEANEPPTGTHDEPVEVQDSTHLDRLVDEQPVVLVDCYADWCGPCQMMEPALYGLAADSDAVVAKVDVDTHQDIARQLGAMSIPTLVLFVDGEPTERLVGAQSQPALEALVERYSNR